MSYYCSSGLWEKSDRLQHAAYRGLPAAVDTDDLTIDCHVGVRACGHCVYGAVAVCMEARQYISTCNASSTIRESAVTAEAFSAFGVSSKFPVPVVGN